MPNFFDFTDLDKYSESGVDEVKGCKENQRYVAKWRKTVERTYRLAYMVQNNLPKILVMGSLWK